MQSSKQSSRRRFTQYKQEFKERIAKGLAPTHHRGHDYHPGIGSSPGIGHKRQRSFWLLLREFFKLLVPFRPIVVAILACVTLSTILGLLPLYGTKLVFDNVLAGHPLDQTLPKAVAPLFPSQPRALLSAVALMTIGLAAVSILISVWSRFHATRITKRLQVDLRRRVFAHAVRLPLQRVYDLKSGGAASLLREDAGGVGELVFAMLFNPWRSIVQLLGSLAILAWTDWRLLLGSLVLLPMVYFTHKTWIGRIRPLFADIRATRTQTDSHATETFGGMRVVRSFSRQRSEAAHFTRNNAMMARQELLAWIWSRAIDVAWGMLIPTATAAVFWYGGGRILDDQARVAAGLIDPRDAMTLGDLMMFLAFLGWLLGPLELLASSATQFQNSLAGFDRVLNVLEEPTEMPDRPNARRLPRSTPPGCISLRGVGFVYPGVAEPVLRNVSLDAQPGEMIAFVGPSGAGKTTLCNLIARFYDPTEGSISFNGIDLRDITLASYRSLLGIVEQDTFLFDGTIADNIRYGRRDASAQEVAHAAKLANADGFITALPKGYDSFVGERGVKLSGGQRQRLTIARAILADPRVLILDEATSNLDTESERLIQSSLHALMAGRTSFVIAHRLSTIRHANRIVVLERGQIVEQGRHEELLERSGRYRQMVEVQTAPPPPPPLRPKPGVAAAPAGA